jgi:hypothetical protein
MGNGDMGRHLTGPLSPSEFPVVDILSIGSKRRLDYLIAQQESFALHASVRHFFTATEADDLDDPYCDSHLTTDDVVGISAFCRERSWNPTSQYLMHYSRNIYATANWLMKKPNPVGWMCAQRRPLYGLYKVFQRYFQKDSDGSRSNTGSSEFLSTRIDDNKVLPDYLIIMDDDTYFNLEQFPKMIAEDVITTHRPLDDPYVLPGCLVRWPIHQINFTFSFGGFGTIFNRASLLRLAEPIHCDSKSNTTSTSRGSSEDACAQVQRNMIGEKKLFQNGMSVVHLMHAYVNHQPYKEYRNQNWTDGYCMHSDW